jgi:hypothetical protein
MSAFHKTISLRVISRNDCPFDFVVLLPGSRARSPGRKIKIQVTPRNFAIGDPIRRERNQRIPIKPPKSGSKKPPTPKP